MINPGIYTSEALGETAEVIQHSSGITILLCQKQGLENVFAGMITKFGSVDTMFLDDGKPFEVADGTAHFLEHKLFESESGGAFDPFAKTGARANAFTSFDKTCYYFTASQNVYESLKILLEFVTSPYFTEETIAKEQGIIGQEIKMYEDLPGWRLIFNLLEALYFRNTARRDIAGTVESIATITPEQLYKIYDTYYNLNNMILAVAGDIDRKKILKLCDECLKPSPPIEIQRVFPSEPSEPMKKTITQNLAVALPMFALGYKQEVKSYDELADDIAAKTLVLELIAGRGSRLYRELYDSGLITSGYFEVEYFCGRGFCSAIFSGESKDPETTVARIREEVERVRREGITDEDFERCKSKLVGMTVKAYNSSQSCALTAAEALLTGTTPFTYAEAYTKLTKADAQKALRRGFFPDYTAVSFIKSGE